MSITLSLLVALLWLLPGVVALILWNQIGRRQGVRHPDQPLTAINGLALALMVSVAAHLVGAAATELLARIAVETGLPSPGTPYRSMAELMTRPTTGANAKAIDVAGMGQVVEFMGVLAVLSLLVGFVFASPGLPLAFDGVDVHGQGWAYQHIVQPKNHGYAPIAFVLTTTFEDGRGLGYAGGIADIRLADTGEIKAVALSEPDRFVYSFRKENAKTSMPGLLPGWLRPASRQVAADQEDLAGFKVEERHPVGGVIHLPAEAIRNILVLNFTKDELEEIGGPEPTEAQPPDDHGAVGRVDGSPAATGGRPR